MLWRNSEILRSVPTYVVEVTAWEIDLLAAGNRVGMVRSISIRLLSNRAMYTFGI